MTVQFYCAWLITNLRNKVSRPAALWNNFSILHTLRLIRFLFLQTQTWGKPSGTTCRVLDTGQQQHPKSAAPTACRIPAFTRDTNYESQDIRTGKDLEKIMPASSFPHLQKRSQMALSEVTELWSSRARGNNSKLSTAKYMPDPVLSALHICSLNLITTLWSRLLSPLILRYYLHSFTWWN